MLPFQIVHFSSLFIPITFLSSKISSRSCCVSGKSSKIPDLAAFIAFCVWFFLEIILNLCCSVFTTGLFCLVQTAAFTFDTNTACTFLKCLSVSPCSAVCPLCDATDFNRSYFILFGGCELFFFVLYFPFQESVFLISDVGSAFVVDDTSVVVIYIVFMYYELEYSQVRLKN